MSPSFELKRLVTGAPGLDDILSGGLPAGQMYLLEGSPGTGKTTLAMQFILEGTRNGERCLYITLSEPRTELELSLRSHGWDPADLPIAEFVPAEASLSAEQQYTVFHPSEVELADTVEKLVATLDEVQPDRLVIDSLSELRLLASDNMRYRRQLLALKQYFAGKSTTVLLLDDLTGNGRDLQLHSIAHGVIRLEKISRSYGATRRQIEIVKLRGSGYREGFHDYVIQRGGVVIFPRLVAAEHGESFDGERMASGLTQLDAMFGGGIARGSSTLFTGPPGSGKSTLAMQFAYAAAARGQRSIVYTFDEVLRTAKDRANALGMHVDVEVARGTLSISQVDPAELSPGEFIHDIRSDVEEHDTRVVVIDSLNGLMNSMPGERDLVMHLHELLSFLNQKGVITLLVLAQQGLVGTMHAQVDVSYLADTVVLMRYFESKGAIRQVISVLKQRVGAHERTLRELTFGANAIEVGEPLVNFQGILTGVPQMLSESEAGGNVASPLHGTMSSVGGPLPGQDAV
ncbi:RecA-superfamily ATPase possibly involved in signal transduction [Terriglobus roseus DSM 18391]|uniref:non-specific serine/threonine protein kinase n=1 Tax=Terriglobus roseus (strain DSM 18391 / NRRL B-41598 / KBS 63) TaxID=926566 RepID=I3ZFF0_TERRK|nr:ATPase domain-containing protein [Terriglobus roseus]AFL87968.1 RecA-superfamily ATPase possibly involved in signal transduction [Terriglobus roseus DSM 18391]